MRTTKDRIRHALSFEIIGLALVTPLGAVAFDSPLDAIGVVAVAGATLATAWNYLYNLGFDHLMQRWRGHTRKTPLLRVFHAILFEAGLLIVLLPFIAWYLNLALIDALLMDISFAAFYLVYAFAFNWAYDLVFPLPAARRNRAPRHENSPPDCAGGP
ncbi:MAG: PACE efflux transporter [Pararhodobacter sp.]|nr:PACE efflux transporter [Pararhodobacter sp.]